MITETLMIAATTGVCSYVAGIVTMGLVAGRKIADLRDDNQFIRTLNARQAITIDELDITNRIQGRELAEYRAARTRSTANLIRANAARKAKRLEREAAAVALRNARHAEMRATLELI